MVGHSKPVSSVAFSPDGARLYVSNFTINNATEVSVIDTATNTVTATDTTGSRPFSGPGHPGAAANHR